MYTQFFGNYLLNNNYVTAGQLAQALEEKSQTRMKLGLLAINAGYMNATQVEKVHKSQATQDKRFGDIAIEMGFMTSEQVNELLSSQKTGYLLIGQALVDKNFMTNEEFEQALKEYKTAFGFTDSDAYNEKTESIEEIISEFYHFGSQANAKLLTDYVCLLFKNIIRFIGDDFTPFDSTVISNFKCRAISSQVIVGTDFKAFTAIEASETTYAQFASRFAQEEISEVNEYAVACVGEFLNLHNGLFTVNMSNENNIELQLDPQIAEQNITLPLRFNAFCIPLVFPFGTVNIIISDSESQ